MRRLFRLLAQVLWVTITALCLLEIIYRCYFFDFYKPELKGLNATALNQPADSTLLVFGDSFSAHPNSYIAVLREKMPNWRIINSAVPGSGSAEMTRMAPDRIRAFAPKQVLFQVYVGNDLLDINHPVNWQQLSFGRNLYWTISDRFEVLNFLNFRFAHLRYQIIDDTGNALLPHDTTHFAPEKYNGRERLYFKAAPDFVINSVLASGTRETPAFQTMVEHLKNTIDLLPPDCRVTILVLPHCAQVSDFYEKNMVALGMTGAGELRQFTFLSALQAAFAGTRVQIRNALPVLTQNDNPQTRVYYENDIHLTLYGQQVVGNWLAQTLE